MMVVGNDSGGMHFANALGAPTVVLFGPTNPLVTSPFMSSTTKIVQSGEPNEGHAGEIYDLPVSRVLNACNELRRA